MEKVRLKDIDEGAYLWIKGLEYAGNDVENLGYKQVVWFNFEWRGDPVELLELRNTYRNGDARVEPKTFASKQFELRKIVQEERQRNR